jgi:predicted nucleic acid-binding protein
MSNILIDTCFWYALFDARNLNHHKANELVHYLDIGNIIIPYPTLYETINTRFTRNKVWVDEFEKLLKNKNVLFVEDIEYKENALSLTFDSTLNRNRPLSLVDMVIRLMLEDVNLKIDYLISFNSGDFIDLCLKKGITLINE